MLAVLAMTITSAAFWVLPFAAFACVAVLRRWKLIKGTTLIGPWAWLLASLVLIAGANASVLLIERAQDAPTLVWKMPVLFAAAATSFCPLMSLLGAKRPQDRGWHFVVASLWGILVLPVAEGLVLRHGQMPDVQGARSWFMLILIAIGIVNSVPTRFWLAGIIFAAGQLTMLAGSLPIVRNVVDQSAPLTGLALCSLGTIAASMLATGSYRNSSDLDAVWLDFRDRFGLLWGLRFAEQVNIAARSADWPFSLRWRGFVDSSGKPLDTTTLPQEMRLALEQVLKNLLRRFVSPDWIASRTTKKID